MMKVSAVTIDGPSGSGKGTVSRLLAQELGFHLLDSGALYRLAALASVESDQDLQDAQMVARLCQTMAVRFCPEHGDVFLGERNVTGDIRREAIGMGASVVASHPQVREALLECQRAFLQEPGLVADGRDMGTTVFPHAQAKVFLSASVEARAQRRYKQLIASGESASLASLARDIHDRDHRDMSRSVSPLKPAVDALFIDSTELSVTEVLDQILQWAVPRLAK